MKALPCPFCGATPHQSQGKVEYDQLHGDPYQRWHIKCPHGHANVWGMNQELALREWNTRAPASAPEEQI